MTGAEWFLGAAILLTFCVLAGWAAGGRRRERFVQPPPSWWVCPACHSVNEAGGDLPLTCYHCGQEADPATVQRLETTPDFEWTQQLATTRKGGWDREVGWAAEHSEPAETAAMTPAETIAATETTTDLQPTTTRSATDEALPER
ncbi:MAG TPA: hypothetical protein VF323_00620 [Candidatus Limnocylindrales bacterium]